MATLTEASVSIRGVHWGIDPALGPILEVELTTLDASGAALRSVRFTTAPGRYGGVNVEAAIPAMPASWTTFLAALEALALKALGIP
ncbi:MAG: hypothetical protein EPN50_05050 [Chloroflexota bacterium]|nr:MAG: hypothetical protein EPN50_05050 [Chloroflexota bacterium]